MASTGSFRAVSVPGSLAGAGTKGKVKGALLLARMHYLREQGAGSAERVLRHLTAADKALVTGALLPGNWYPADVLLRLEMTTAAVLANGDRARMFLDMGRVSAEANLGPKGSQRAHMRQGAPQFLLQRVPELYASNHSTGSRTYETAGPFSAVIRTFGQEAADAEDCLTAVGWLERAIELSGGRAARVVETRCQARGAECCEYRCEWKAVA
jgi:uncharacterized protein (TIGR02265 family)